MGEFRPSLLAARLNFRARIVQLACVLLMGFFFFLGLNSCQVDAFVEKKSGVTEVQGDVVRTENDSFRMGVEFGK
ncbi:MULTISPECIES: hypothetical protein [Streptomyces griseus group]|uniref:hypothetical protein n=1 Tax=Streptomyces griseus group TaxID=629295 RepID=UPI002E158DFD|nr:hypothetical protein OG366_00245 [Streptomyces cyaneofuscatus]WSI52700.1 hypothetical protein OG366_36915 [Streptomyces cyaneofuscatus]WST12511.1 hypothetical protein OG721_00330 [Streptomyces microflavus]WST19526.1 hypothetical protein OG721_38770 [Streptomyces microflavus]